ncbi:hypothetical protein DA530_14235 [Salmonella enterica]|nr:hypothetical protein [Salmonella enterica]
MKNFQNFYCGVINCSAILTDLSFAFGELIRGLLFANFFFPEKNRGIERKILFRMMPSTQNVLTLNRNLLLYADNFLSMLILKFR